MFKSLKVAAFALATVGMVTPQGAFANEIAKPTVEAKASHVKLVDGKLVGRVITADGQPIATTVKVSHKGQEVAATTSNDVGAYEIAGLRSGQYTVSTPDGSANVRVWENAAPPAAGDSLVIANGPVVRGQLLGAGLFGTSTLVTVGVVGAVVGTAVAVSEANDDDPPPASP